MFLDGDVRYTTMWIVHFEMVRRVHFMVCIFYLNKKFKTH